VAAVTFLVDGAAAGTDTTAPYALVYTVPASGSSLTVGALVTDTEGNSGVALDSTANLGADPVRLRLDRGSFGSIRLIDAEALARQDAGAIGFAPFVGSAVALDAYAVACLR
jgi:hypothetical protein